MDYLYDVFSLVRNRTLSIEAHFQPREEDSPLKIFGDEFSRFTFCIIDNGNPITANVRLSKFIEIREKTRFLYNKYLEDSLFGSKEKSKETSVDFEIPSCMKLRFFSPKELEGKTPAQVMLEESGYETLKKQYEFLKSNLSKYPKNKQMMDAINEAVSLSQAKQLRDIYEAVAKIDDISSSERINIYTTGVRPLCSSKRHPKRDNKNFCYNLSIDYCKTDDYPFSVTIENFYAPVVPDKKNPKLNNVLVKEKDADGSKAVFKMTYEEWLNAIESMQRNINAFADMRFPIAYEPIRELENQLNAQRSSKAS